MLRTDPELAGTRADLDRDPDKTLVFAGEMNMDHDMGGHDMGHVSIEASVRAREAASGARATVDISSRRANDSSGP